MTNANTENPNTQSPDTRSQDAHARSNFLRDQIAEDVRTKKYGDAIVQTRFPPEPNGYLHIGHAKAICLDFGLADEFGGKTNLRFDDTNPEKEEQEYVDSIRRTCAGSALSGSGSATPRTISASSTSGRCKLIKAGKAYVDDLTADEIRQYRGTLTEPGKDSPYRNRSVEENLDLFQRMKNGEFPDGSRVLRAKIDMASPNLNMRDPVMYRILHATHQRTGDEWCIYPMYDYAHGQSDSIETRHPLDVHARVRRPPAALSLVYRAARHLSFAADRIRPPQPDLHAAQQAQASAARAGEACQRLGRSAHAHALRHPPPRLYARGDSRFRCAQSAPRAPMGSRTLRCSSTFSATT